MKCVVPRDMLDMAREYLDRPYAPYSGFRVVAVVRGGSGRLYPGVNIENASYGLTICAERVAVFNAVLNGDRSIREVFVATVDEPEVPFPCGACLQVVSEFGDDSTMFYLYSFASGKVLCYRLEDLLPHRFRLEIDRGRSME